MKQILAYLLTLKIYIISFLIYSFFHIFFEGIISKYLVIPVISKFDQGIFSFILCLAILIFTITIFIINVRRKKIALNSILTPTLILLYYSFYRFSNESPWLFYSYQDFCVVKFSDILIISLTLLLIQWNPKKQILKDSIFLEDCFDTFGKVDALKRNTLVDRIAKSITGTNLKKSFAIGISGKWGSGKSVILELLKTNLKDEIVIEYSPWKREKKIDIIKDFFERLQENAELRKYPTLSASLIEYGQTVLQNSPNFNIQSLYSTFFKFFNVTKQNEEEKLRNILIKKKLIILIDDLDRLDKEEILEILKLVRNTFSFPNTFFVVTYDREHILKLLSKESESYAGYLDKIFQLEIPIPIYPDYLIYQKTIELLSKDRTENELMSISAPMDHLSSQLVSKDKNLITFFIRDLRDAIRFVNSFNFNYSENIRDGIAIEDFIILELIKTKYQFLFSLLKEDFFLNFDNGKATFERIEISQENKNLFPYELSKEEINALNRTLERLYYPENRPPESIIYSLNKLAYFSSDLFDNIPYSQIKELRLKELLGDVKILITNWKKKNKSFELYTILYRIDEFLDFRDFRNVIYSFAYLFEENDPMNIQIEIINRIKNFKSNRFTPNEVEAFVENLLSDTAIPTILRSTVCFEFLSDKIYNNDSLDFIPLQKLKSLNLNILSDHYNNFGFDARILSIYRCNVDSIDITNNIIITSEANHFLRKILFEDSEIFKTFLNDVIIPEGNSYDRFTIWGFVEQIFEKANIFFEYLKSSPDSIEKYEVLTILRKLNYQDLGIKFATHKRYSIEIPSDNEVNYLEFSDGSINKTYVIQFSHLWENDLKIKPNFEKLGNSNWIAHNFPISDKEALNGGVYKLEREINLNLKNYKLIKGEIYYVVDDFLSLTINKKIICEKIQSLVDIKIITIDIDLLNDGSNSFLFEIENADGLGYKKDHPLSLGEQNPYGIVFNIILQFQKI